MKVIVSILFVFCSLCDHGLFATDDAWIRGVHHAFEPNSPPETTDRYFAEAIKNAKGNVADIIVCYSDIMHTGRLHSAIAEAIEFGGNSPKTLIDTAIRDATLRGKEKPHDWVDLHIAESTLRLTVERRRRLVQALQIDPEYKPALLRLLIIGDDNLRELTFQQLSETASQNCFPFYLRAAQAWKQFPNLLRTLEIIREGNKRTSFEWYPTPLPTKFTFAIPDSPEARKLNVVGKSVWPSTLRYTVSIRQQANDFSKPFYNPIEEMSIEFLRECEKQIDVEGPESISKMARQMMLVEPPESAIISSGIRISVRAGESLIRIGRIQGNHQMVKKNKQLLIQLSEFRQLFAKTLEESQVGSEQDRIQLIDGKDFCKAEGEAIRRLRKNTILE